MVVDCSIPSQPRVLVLDNVQWTLIYIESSILNQMVVLELLLAMESTSVMVLQGTRLD